jgi:hypothetical protein
MQQPVTPRFEPMTVGMILDSTIRLYMQNMTLMIGIVAFSYLPYLVFLLLITVAVPPGGGVPVLAIILGAITAVLWMLIAQPLSVGATTYAMSERYLRHPVSIVDALRAAWKRYTTLLWAQAIVGLVIMVGFLLFIIPGILWTLSYALVAPVIVLEPVNAWEGRQRSWELVTGERGKVFLVLVVVSILTSVVSGAAEAVVPWLIDTSSLSGQLSLQVLSQLVSYLVIPIPAIATVLLYYDLRIRKEGFDLEMLSQALAQPSR